MESTDTNYRINRDGPWGSIFKPNASRTAIPVAGARWTAKHGELPACAKKKGEKKKSRLTHGTYQLTATAPADQCTATQSGWAT